MSRALVVALGVAAVFVAPGRAQAQAKVTFADDSLRLPAAAAAGAGRIGVKAEGVAADAAGKLTVTDLGSVDPAPTKVTFDTPVAVERGTATRLWLVTATVEGLPAGASQVRHARLTLDGAESLARYTLTNLPLSTFTWSVAAPPAPWIVWRGWTPSPPALALVVTTGDGAASGLRIAQAQLQEAGGTAQIGLSGLRLCDAAEGGACGELSVDARSNRTVYLRLAGNSSPTGKYTGTVGLAIRERPELQTVSLTLQASSLCLKLLGGTVLALGVLLAWVVNVGARGHAARLEALKPVAALKETIDGLRSVLMTAPAAMPKPAALLRELSTLEATLTPRSLENAGRLPPVIPRPWGATDTAAALQKHLTETATRVAAFSIVIKEGLQVLWAKAPPGAPPDALARLDGEGAAVTTEAAARDLVKTVLAPVLVPKGGVADPSGVVVRGPTVEQLRWQLMRIYGAGWLVSTLLTIATGVVALVVPNAGFGAPLDVFFCLLWGFGLPTTIDRVQQLGAGGVASSLNISVPKP